MLALHRVLAFLSGSHRGGIRSGNFLFHFLLEASTISDDKFTHGSAHRLGAVPDQALNECCGRKQRFLIFFFLLYLFLSIGPCCR